MRRFLFLQGPASSFFARLAQRLQAEGHRVWRVNFCAGDAVYFWGCPALNFCGKVQHLRDWLDVVYRRYGITDQILFGDRRPVHRPAVDLGEVRGVRTHVFEEGYFRPYCVTLERDGVNGHSLLPRDPDWFREVGRSAEESAGTVSFRSPFRIRAAHDVAYHLAGLLNPVLFPGYRTHAALTACAEYLGYMQRFSMLKFIRAREHARVQSLVEAGKPFFVLPLQLNGDAQIRDHSRFEHMGEVIEYVLASFAKHASAESRIAIKNHPLDTGLMDYGRIVQDCARRFGLVGRTVYLEDGDLTLLVRHSQGVVTVNSTVGIVALEQGIPTITLSDPIYNLPGLTFQGGLVDFWQTSMPPDAEFFRCFRRVVMKATQINGGLYCRTGIQLAVDNASRVLTAERSPLEAML